MVVQDAQMEPTVTERMLNHALPVPMERQSHRKEAQANHNVT